MNNSEQFDFRNTSLDSSVNSQAYRYSTESVKSILQQSKYKENADYEYEEDIDEKNLYYDKELSQSDIKKKVEFKSESDQFQYSSILFIAADGSEKSASNSQPVNKEEIENYENEELVDNFEEIIDDHEIYINEENDHEEFEEVVENVCVLNPVCEEGLYKRRGVKKKSFVSSKMFCEVDLLLEPFRTTFDFKYLPCRVQENLSTIANRLLSFGKGILSVDDSITAIGRHLNLIELRNTPENRFKFREIILTADEALNYISGIVFADESMGRKTTECVPFIDVVNQRQILFGLKLDQGQMPLYWSDNETTSIGLDNLHRRCRHYKNLGCTFATWHCIFKIGEHTPSYQAIHENARILARYASICQSLEILPIIEPEIVLVGNYAAQKITETIIAVIFKTLNDNHIYLEGLLLKLNFISRGTRLSEAVLPNEVPLMTTMSLQRVVPPAVAGVILVAGEQSLTEYSKNLMFITKLKRRRTPWPITFSFEPHLQVSAMQAWNGDNDRILAAQREMFKEIEFLSRSIYR